MSDENKKRLAMYGHPGFRTVSPILMGDQQLERFLYPRAVRRFRRLRGTGRAVIRAIDEDTSTIELATRYGPSRVRRRRRIPGAPRGRTRPSDR